MCRWLVYYGLREHPVSIADVTLNTNHAIFREQVTIRHEANEPHNNPNTMDPNCAQNIHGWGLAWWEGGDSPKTMPNRLRYPVRPDTDDSIEYIINNLPRSHLVFAHIRQGPNEGSAKQANCHPFQFGRILFMHNGFTGKWDKVKNTIRARIEDLSHAALSAIAGDTDSEFIAALFVSHLTYEHHRLNDTLPSKVDDERLWLKGVFSPLNFEQALRRTIFDLNIEIQTYGGYQGYEYSSWNFAISNGDTLLVMRYANSRDDTRKAPTLCLSRCSDSTSAEGQARGPHIIIASEPWETGQNATKLHLSELVPGPCKLKGFTDASNSHHLANGDPDGPTRCWYTIPQNHFLIFTSDDLEDPDWDLPIKQWAIDRFTPVQRKTLRVGIRRCGRRYRQL